MSMISMVRVNQIYLIINRVHFLVDIHGLKSQIQATVIAYFRGKL
jgi:hypothetical protein